MHGCLATGSRQQAQQQQPVILQSIVVSGQLYGTARNLTTGQRMASDRQIEGQAETESSRQSDGKLTTDCISRATEVGLIAQRWTVRDNYSRIHSML